MDPISLKYVSPAPELAWVPKLEDVGAGLYLLAGRCHVAQHHTPEALALVERGALHIGNLRFDRDGSDARRRGRRVRAVNSREAVRRFVSTWSRN
jgi:hypothetical protein